MYTVMAVVYEISRSQCACMSVFDHTETNIQNMLKHTRISMTYLIRLVLSFSSWNTTLWIHKTLIQ